MHHAHIRTNPSIRNYFIGDQYRCQPKCIMDGFWTPDRVVAENDNGSRPVLEWAIKHINLSMPLDVLDIGCGPSQKMSRLFGDLDTVNITGLDSREATTLARRFNPSGTYIECDLDSDQAIAKASAQMGRFDVIFCLDVIEHVLHPEKMLHLIKAHSKQTTSIYLTTLERDLSKNAGALAHGSAKAEHVREWNTAEFREFVEYMGFVVRKYKITPLRGEQFCQTLLCSLGV